MKALILSCGTGEGHNSAAEALAEAFAARGMDCEIRDSVSFRSEKSRRAVSAAYNGLIRKAPTVFGAIYRLGKLYDDLRLPSPVYSWNAKHADSLFAYIRENRFDVAICTHLFGMETMTAVRRLYAPYFPCYGVLTDYTAIPFYKDTDLDAYFVPHEGVRDSLTAKGKRSEAIYCTGIPVAGRFGASMSKREARAAADLPQDARIVAVMTGGAGCGRTVRLCRALDKELGGESVVCVFVGRNAKKKAALERRFGASPKFRILGFTNQVDVYLKAADLVFSKPGGLSSTEIAVAAVPLIHLKAIPGCETANRIYFSERGMSVYRRTARRAVRAAMTVLSDDAAAESMRKNQRGTVCADSADRIAQIVSELYHGE